MQPKLLSLVAVLGIALGGAAFAKTEAAEPPTPHGGDVAVSGTHSVWATGTIAMIGPDGQYIVVNGARYLMPSDIGTEGLKVGERVTLTYHTLGTERVTSTIGAA